MKIYVELMTLLLVSWYGKSEAQQPGVFEAFLPQFRIAKELALNILSPPSRNVYHLRMAERLHKLQPRLRDDIPFPCNLNNTRSKARPKSVHALRPGDIDVVGAMGDSLTSGNNVAGTTLFHTAVENRGLSFSIGGQGTWRQFVTLPNILKEFNPRLIGYSLKDSFGHNTEAQFNAAEPGAISIDMPYMAKVLIKRMKDDPRVNILEDWKMVTFLIGPNDFCGEMCSRSNPYSLVEDHRKDLLTVLRILRDNLPRTLVNIVITPNVKTLTEATVANKPGLPGVCYFTHNIACPCLTGLQFERFQAKFLDVILKWQQVEMEVVREPEFDRDDFAVVAQPFILHYKLPTTKEGLADYSVLSPDCFHFSQKEVARAALSLWNNILEPVGRKSTHLTDLFNFRCPTHNTPFIFTNRNS